MAAPILHVDVLTSFSGYDYPVSQWIYSVRDALEMDNQGPVDPNQVISMMGRLLGGPAADFVSQIPELLAIVANAENNQADEESLENFSSALEARFTSELSEPRQRHGESIMVYYARMLGTMAHICRHVFPGQDPGMIAWPQFVEAFIEGLIDEHLRAEARLRIAHSFTLEQGFASIRAAIHSLLGNINNETENA